MQIYALFTGSRGSKKKMAHKFVEAGEFNTLHKVFFGKSSAPAFFLLASLFLVPYCVYAAVHILQMTQ